MPQLDFSFDFVQLPVDSSGKKTAFLRWDTGGGNYLYIPVSIPVDESGNLMIAAANADNVSDALKGVWENARLYLFDGSGWDRAPGDSQYGIDVDITRVSGLKGATPNPATVPQTASETTLLAAQASRVRASFFNDSNAILYVGEGSFTLTPASFSHKLYPGEELIVDDYTGLVKGVWDAPGSGSAMVSEVQV